MTSFLPFVLMGGGSMMLPSGSVIGSGDSCSCLRTCIGFFRFHGGASSACLFRCNASEYLAGSMLPGLGCSSKMNPTHGTVCRIGTANARIFSESARMSRQQAVVPLPSSQTSRPSSSCRFRLPPKGWSCGKRSSCTRYLRARWVYVHSRVVRMSRRVPLSP